MLIGEFEQQSADRLDYDIDFGRWLISGDELLSVTHTVFPAGLVVEPATVDSPRAKLWVSGGTSGSRYQIDATATTNDGRVLQVEIKIRVKDY